MSTPQRRHAIVVGVRSYGDANQNDLQYTSDDAQALCAVLLDRAGFAENDVHLFCDGPQGRLAGMAREPKRSDILSSLKAVAQSATDADLVLFYFAGHGAEISGKHYLITNDTRMNVVDETALDAGVVNQYFEECKASHIVRLFDACRIGTGTRATGEAMSDGLASVLLKKSRGWLTFSSCSSGELSHEPSDLKHGLFTFYLIQGIKGAAQNDKGMVTMEGLVDYVKLSVANWTRERGFSQTPHSVSDLSGSLVLVARAPPEPTKPSQPTSDLGAELRVHLDALTTRISPEARRLRPTANASAANLLKFLLPYLRDAWAPLVGTKLSAASDSALAELRRGEQAYDWVVERCRGIDPDSKAHEVWNTRVTFRPVESFLPGATLDFFLARLDFFYVLVYSYSCSGLSGWTGWRPESAGRHGSFVIILPGVVDETLIRTEFRRMTVSLCSDYTMWAEAAVAYLEKRASGIKESGVSTA
jgi:hypothetical protein